MTMTMREIWYKHSRNALKQCGKLSSEDTSTIGRRVALHESIRRHAVDGKVSLSYDQMDCDCVRWTDGYVVPAIPRHVERLIEQVYADAEGPVYAVWIDKPDAYAQYYARDLALEAHENGHPHVVYT